MLISCGLDVDREGESTLLVLAALSHVDFRLIDFDFFIFERKYHYQTRLPTTELNTHLCILQLAMTFDMT